MTYQPGIRYVLRRVRTGQTITVPHGDPLIRTILSMKGDDAGKAMLAMARLESGHAIRGEYRMEPVILTPVRATLADVEADTLARMTIPTRQD
jgi:hypothetical protein